MNLLDDPWIPVRTRRGATRYVAPWQITEGVDGEDPITASDLPRPDFNGALAQFLVGVLQTAFTPKDARSWERLYLDPPDSQTLRSTLAPWRDAFELGGNGRRFMQDVQLDIDALTPRNIHALLIDAPAENTQELNKDLFVKRGSVDALGLPMAALALYTLQTNAPAGGAGFRTSLRGGGPLTTLVVPDPSEDPARDTLWHLVWLNVLPDSEIRTAHPDIARNARSDMLPWLAPTRTSNPKNGGRDTTPDDAHPFQAYWGMPRRILLDLSDTETGTCGLTGWKGPTVSRWWTRNYGVNYTGPWKHPLSPYRRDKDGLPIPLHPQPGGLGYRHWLGLVLGDGKNSIPARVVRWAWSRNRGPDRFRVWAFGYNMDKIKKMKARCWYESLMPAWHMDADTAAGLSTALEEVLAATTLVAENLRQALKNAWFRPGAKPTGDLSPIQGAFWRHTEAGFFTLLQALYSSTRAGTADSTLRQDWFRAIDRASLDLFDQWAAAGEVGEADPKRIALARADLQKFNRKKAIAQALRLAPKPQSKRKTTP